MATAMLTDRGGVRRKMAQTEPKPKKAPKRKNSSSAKRSAEQNNNVKRPHLAAGADSKDDMLAAYQPWVIQTYGDLAKTKTITLKKYARILRTLRGEEIVSADNSKFRFWVKAKGFHVGKPPGYDAKPADAIVGRYSVCDVDDAIPPVSEKLAGSAKDPSLYVPNAPFKNSVGEPVYRKVAVVENFFDIIYSVHVELEGRPGKHAGQKRTYRTITETYAFLPREAVTRFLLGCTECQKHPRSPSPLASVLPTPSPSPTLPPASTMTPLLPVHVVASGPPTPDANTHVQPVYLEIGKMKPKSPLPDATPVPAVPSPRCLEAVEAVPLTRTPELCARRPSHPLDVCNLTSREPPRTPHCTSVTWESSTPPKKRHLNHLSDQPAPSGLRATPPPPPPPPPSSAPKLWSPVESIEREQTQRRPPPAGFTALEIDYSLPITTTYLKYMRSLGCTDEDALKFENKHVSCLIEHFLHDAISHYFY